MAGEIILIAEDDGILATSPKRFCRDSDTFVSLLLPQGEGRRIAKNRIPDLIVLDIELAGKSTALSR